MCPYNIIITTLISYAIRDTRYKPLKIFFGFLGNNHNRIRALSVFTGKNSKALKRSKHKGFSVFLLYGMLAILVK